MDFKLIGTAAGGAFPQWNCACNLCSASRLHPELVPPRLQLQAALSTDPRNWFLLHASPDIRFQIEANPELHPHRESGSRNTPIQGIVLTNADLDQALGLLLLREFQPLTVYTTTLIRQTLEANPFFRMMHRVPGQLTWIEIQPAEPFQLADGIVCTPIALEASLPFYAQSSNLDKIPSSRPGEAAFGLLLETADCRLAYTPSVPEVTSELKAIYDSCDVIFVDGTFWSDDELRQTHPGTPLARSIGHVPISGDDGLIALLADVSARRKVFLHINNTNPILDPRSAESQFVRAAGWEIGWDGWQLP